MQRIWIRLWSDFLHTGQTVHSFPDMLRLFSRSHLQSVLPGSLLALPYWYLLSQQGTLRFLYIFCQKLHTEWSPAYPVLLHMRVPRFRKYRQLPDVPLPDIRLLFHRKWYLPGAQDADMFFLHLDRMFLFRAFRSSQRILLLHPSCWRNPLLHTFPE